MKIIFYYTDFDETAAGTTENKKERIPKVRLSVNENDLIERRYDLQTFWKIVNSSKIKVSGKTKTFLVHFP